MKRVLFPLLFLTVFSGCATSDPEPAFTPGQRAILDMIERRDTRNIEMIRSANENGRKIAIGYSQLREGMTEAEVDRAFQSARFSQSLEVCGQSERGPVTCLVRLYTGVHDTHRVSSTLTFWRNADGQWKLMAWKQ